jgi:hypothetical protein
MHQGIYTKLKSVAKSQGITTYSEIAPMAGLDMANPDDRNKMGELLGEISTFEHNQKPPRPLLSAVVIHRDNNIPGKGFFTLARDLGLQSATTDDLLFFIGELRRVHDYWRTA